MTYKTTRFGQAAIALLLGLYLFPVFSASLPFFPGTHSGLDAETAPLVSISPDQAAGTAHVAQRTKSNPSDAFCKSAALPQGITAGLSRTSLLLPRNIGERPARPTGQAPSAIRAPPVLQNGNVPSGSAIKSA